MKQPINILCGLDESYVQHCAVMLSSLFHSSPRARLRVFLATQDLTEASLNQFRRLFRKCDHEMVPVYSDREELSKAPVLQHISAATYLRLLVEHLLPSDLDRVLYLDSDMIIRSDLQPFYEQDLEGNLVAAVAEAPVEGQNQRLGMAEDVKYFNAGVILINLALWREQAVGERALRYAIENAERIEWGDQDALNATVHGQVKICPPKWNAGEWVYSGLTAAELDVDPAELERAVADPCIAHFTGARKPWGMDGSSHPFGHEYYQHLRRTPYFGRRHMLKRLRIRGRQVLQKISFGSTT